MIKSQLENPLIIVPNWYWTLWYAKELLDVISQDYANTSLLELPGQTHTKGTLNFKSWSKELLKNINNNKNSKVNLLLHCSSLMLLECISEDVWDKLDKVIIYSYLADPQKHLLSFQRKSKIYGMRLDNSINNISRYVDPKVYEKIQADIHVIHPKIPLNVVRANDLDLETLSKNSNIVDIIQPVEGYEISNDNQSDKVEKMYSDYMKPILSA